MLPQVLHRLLHKSLRCLQAVHDLGQIQRRRSGVRSLLNATIDSVLADEGHQVSEQYGVWGEKSFAGRKYMGVERATFVIGADGNVLRVMRKVDPKTHADDVLAALGA